MTTLLKRKKVLAASKSGAAPFGGLVSTANLVSYWKLNEVSGTRVDSFGTNHMAPTNNPVGIAGKIGNGCDFTASGAQWLSYPDVSPLGDIDFTHTLWFKRKSTSASQIIITKLSIYTIDVDNTGAIRIYLGDSSIGQVIVFASNDMIWHFAVAWHNSVANTINMQVDNGTVASAATTAAVPTSGAAVNFGRSDVFGQAFDGLIDEVSLWRRILTPAERTALYNSGNGLTY